MLKNGPIDWRILMISATTLPITYLWRNISCSVWWNICEHGRDNHWYIRLLRTAQSILRPVSDACWLTLNCRVRIGFRYKRLLKLAQMCSIAATIYKNWSFSLDALQVAEYAEIWFYFSLDAGWNKCAFLLRLLKLFIMAQEFTGL